MIQTNNGDLFANDLFNCGTLDNLDIAAIEITEITGDSYSGWYSWQTVDNTTFGPVDNLDGTVEGTAGDDLINVNYTGDPDGDRIDNNDAIVEGEGPQDDIVVAGAGNDTVLAGEGNDDVFGGEGDDTLFGGAGDDILRGEEGDDLVVGNGGDDQIFGGTGNDVLYGDNLDGATAPKAVRESFEWDKLSEHEIDNSVAQSTGNVTVTYTRTQDDGHHYSKLGSDHLNTDGINSGGEHVDGTSSLKSVTNGPDGAGAFQWEFSESVNNVSFNINDIDGDGVVVVTAFDAQGNEIEVNLTGGSKLTLLDNDDVEGAETADSDGGFDHTNSPDYNLNVSIPGPVSKIVVEHDQNGHENSGIFVTDIYFDAMVDVPIEGGPDGDDFISGGEGDDIAYGQGGDDEIEGGTGDDSLFGGTGNDTISGDEGDDYIEGGAGDDEIFGGSGNDVIYGDNKDGSGDPVRESFEWDKLSEEQIDSTVAQSTGNVTVTYKRTQDEGNHSSELGTDHLYTDGINSGGEEVDTDSSLKSLNDGGHSKGEFEWEFSEEVSDVSFNINDIDGNSIVRVTAFNGEEEVEVDLTAGPGLSLMDGVADSDGNYTDTDTVDHNLNVSIPGPVTRIVVEHDQDGGGRSGIHVTDIYFDAPSDGGVGGDDVIFGGAGDDVIYGQEGNDTITSGEGDNEVYGGDDEDVIFASAGDFVDGGAGGEDFDTLDLTGQGAFYLTGPDGTGDPVPDSNGNGLDGRVVFVDDHGDETGEIIDFVEIEKIIGNEVNRGPEAEDDARSIDEDGSATDLGNVLDNDTDPDGDDLTVSAVNGNSGDVGETVEGSAGGSFVIGSDGSLTFDPAGDFESLNDGESTTTSVSYSVDDGNGGTDTATVTVTVTGVNDAPVAVGNAYVVTADEASGDVDGNVITDDTGDGVDSDVDNDLSDLVVSRVDDEEDNVGQPVSGDNGGTFTINPDGSVDFDAGDDFSGLAEGESETTSITYTVADPAGLESTATVSFTVTGTNEGPVAVPDTGEAGEDDGATDLGNVLDNDTDANDDDLSVSEVNGETDNVGEPTAGDEGGLFTIEADGSISFDPNGEFESLGEGEEQKTQVTYTVTDPSGAEDTTTVTVTVTGTNDAPVAMLDEGETDQDTVLTLENVLENDTDAENDPLTVYKVAGDEGNVGKTVAGESGGLFTINADGSASFDPNGEFDELGEGEEQTTQITYTVTDPDGEEDTTTVTVTVTGTNDGPVAVEDSFSVGEDDAAATVGNVLANDTDPDGDDLTVSEVNGDSGNVGTQIAGDNGGLISIASDGTVTFDPNGEFETLAEGEIAETTVSYTVADPSGAEDTATVTISVVGVNDAPVAVDNVYTVAFSETAGDIDGNVITDDTGAGIDSDPEGDPLTVVGVGLPSGNVGTAVSGDNGGLFTINEDGTIDFDANGEFDDVGLNSTAETSVSYTISDGNGGIDTATVTVTVTGINDGTVQGTDGDDVIELGYTDADGDKVDGNDAILPGDVGNDDLIFGFDGDDTIRAGDGDDEVYGGEGNDSIAGGPGDDTLFGDEGDDDIIGGDGNDTLFGGVGNDMLDGAKGDDSIYGGDGEDFIQGGDGDDYIEGGAGNDSIFGGTGSDEVYGGEGDDFINTGNHDAATDYDYPGFVPFPDNDQFPDNDKDLVYGGAGNDTILTGDDDDTIFGGAGNDFIDAGIDDDVVYGDAGDDTIIGGQGEDVLYGGDGDDLIYGGLETDLLDEPDATDIAPDDNRDTIYGGAGNDTIYGRDDDDLIYGGDGDDLLYGGVDDDEIYGGAGNDEIYGGEGNDLIQGGGGEDLIYGGAGDDTISGGPDADTIYGGDGNDSISGGLGSDGDLLYGDAGDDKINGGEGDDTIFGGTGNDFLSGNGGDDTLFGGDGDDSLVGSDGRDSLYGGDGDDTLRGNAGDDYIEGGTGNDDIFAGDGDDEVYGGDGDDTIRGGAGDDEIYGGAGDDLVQAGDGNDLIYGGDGVDTLFGGFGSDTFFGGNGGDVVVGGEGPDDGDFDVLDLTGFDVDRIDYKDADVGGGEDDAESGRVYFKDGTTMTFEEIENVIPCFTPGTTIATPKGERLVEELQPGDKVITRDNGIQEIAWVGHKFMDGKQLATNPHLKPILIKAGSLGGGLPERDMLVSPNHRVLVASELTQLYFEEREVLAAAKHMTGTDGIQALDVMNTTYVHFMFERHEVVLSNGAWTESFQPGDYSLKGIGNSQRNEIFELFPELATQEGRGDYTAARRMLKKHEARLLMK